MLISPHVSGGIVLDAPWTHGTARRTVPSTAPRSCGIRACLTDSLAEGREAGSHNAGFGVTACVRMRLLLRVCRDKPTALVSHFDVGQVPEDVVAPFSEDRSPQ